MIQIAAPPGAVIVHYPGVPPYQHIPVYYLQYDSSDDEKIRQWLMGLLTQHDASALTVKEILTNLTPVIKSDNVTSHDLESYQIGQTCKRCGKSVGDDNFTDECQS